MSSIDGAHRFVPVADHALLVEFTEATGAARDPEAERVANERVVALDHVISATEIAGVVEVVPALVNLLIRFDPLLTDHAAVARHVRAVLEHATDVARIPTTHRLPVCYESEVAPDLASVADQCGLSVEQVIGAHLSGDYSVLMYGFAPGYAYLGGVPSSIHVPRKPTPVRGVAAGSVIVAGPQCLITTITMPTGWSIIGTSPAIVLPADPDQPFLFDPGDRIEFERIDLNTLAEIRAAA